jgi:DNA-nicking Smr family endonuclease
MTKRRKRDLTGDEAALFVAAMRDASPLKKRAVKGRPAKAPVLAPEKIPAAAAKPRLAGPAGKPAPARPRTIAPPPLAHGRAAGLDRATAERLSKGRLPVEATLDLHGMTQAEAHRALARFVERSVAARRRCVLVVTGRGLFKAEGGVLREAAPRWLNEAPLRAHVLGFDYAQSRHGGAGALYVLLKRRRP